MDLVSKESNGAFILIRQKTEGGPAEFGELHAYLADEIGLTGQIASLLLLLFVRYEDPEYQVQLVEQHGMSMADGSPLLGTRLTPNLIPLLAWDDDLAAKAVSVGPATKPCFDDVKHHLSTLCPQAGGCTEDLAALAALDETLLTIAGKINLARQVLRSMEGGESAELEAGLDRLSRISGDDYYGVYSSIRSECSSITGLSDDLKTLQQLYSLKNDAAAASLARTYINDAQVPAMESPSLAVDRGTLLTGLSPSRLLGAKSLGWNTVNRDANAFKVRYSQAYKRHHQQFHDALPRFQAELTTAKKKASAIGLLDTLAKLGPPAGPALETQLEALPVGPCPCGQDVRELDLSGSPVCSECQIDLNQAVPVTELARLAPLTDMTLGGKTQELSRLLVEKVLEGHTNERWNEFLQIVQASKLSSLANTIDRDLISFVKEVLD